MGAFKRRCPHRPVEGGVAEAEQPAVVAEQHVPLACGCGGHADDRTVEAGAGHVAGVLRRPERVDRASGLHEPVTVALGRCRHRRDRRARRRAAHVGRGAIRENRAETRDDPVAARAAAEGAAVAADSGSTPGTARNKWRSSYAAPITCCASAPEPRTEHARIHRPEVNREHEVAAAIERRERRVLAVEAAAHVCARDEQTAGRAVIGAGRIVLLGPPSELRVAHQRHLAGELRGQRGEERLQPLRRARSSGRRASPAHPRDCRSRRNQG